MQKALSQNTAEELIALGHIIGPHGLHGAVKIKSYTQEANNIFSYGVLYNKETIALGLLKPCKKADKKQTKPEQVIAFLQNSQHKKLLNNREDAFKMRGTTLYIKHHQLIKNNAQQDDDTFYYADLINMDVLDSKSDNDKPKNCGTVIAIYNFGAGDILEIQAYDGRKTMLCFNEPYVQKVDLQSKQMIVNTEGSIFYD
ncbi:MAG: ribosome maturation factor RimM [Pseudomonadota bacterium]